MEKELEEGEGLIGQMCKSRQFQRHNNHAADSFKFQSMVWLCSFTAKLSANVLEVNANKPSTCSNIRIAGA